MALANKFNYTLLNTSNKSELAVGYGTLYGDMAGGLSILGDVYKTQIYALAQYINREREIIPNNIITKPPSAELRPGQKDTDSLPEYQILDRVLYEYIERTKGPKEIIALGYDAQLVARILKLVNRAEYKRNQFCPILRVSKKSFGVGRRVPIVAKYLIQGAGYFKYRVNTENEILILPIGTWILTPFPAKRGHHFGYYLAWSFFTSMGITELAHFVFPFLTKEPYGYFPGMASVIVLALLAW